MLGRYVAYQVPGVAFVAAASAIGWWGGAISGTLAVGFVALWVAKDVALYPVVRRSYVRGETPAAQLVGRHAEVVRGALAPSGWVSLDGELWRAEVDVGRPSIDAGRGVVVRGVDGLVLVVEAADEPAPRR